MKIVRYVGNKGCSDAGYMSALVDGTHVVIDPCSKLANVLIRFTQDDHPVRVSLSALHRDFLDLAVAIYVADEFYERKRADDGWTRNFEYVLPVKDPVIWSAAEQPLQRCLLELSGDLFEFDWVKRSSIPRMQKSRRWLPNGFEVVCLFSGGIDSLLGAWQLLSAGKKVLLVGHQADGLTAKAQSEIVGALAKMFPGAVALVQVRVSRAGKESPRFKLPEKKEETHRPRSFLFLSLAVCVSSAVGIEQIYIPENGLIALNPPLQISRTGTLSTRTAHPMYLTRFQNLVHSIGAFRGALQNPFLYESKTDMLRRADPVLHPLLLRSVSCARPSRYQNRGVRHCGYCVPCLFRRAAMSVAGLDRATDYAFDVLQDFSKMTAITRADFKALTRFAARIPNASESQLENLVVAHGSFSPEVGAKLGPYATTNYTPWTAMIRRWAAHFLEYVDGTATTQVKRAVGMT